MGIAVTLRLCDRSETHAALARSGVFPSPLLVLVPAHEPSDHEACWQADSSHDERPEHAPSPSLEVLRQAPRSNELRVVGFTPRRRCVSHALSHQNETTGANDAGSASLISGMVSGSSVSPTGTAWCVYGE